MSSKLRQLAKAVFAVGDVLSPSLSGPRILIYHQIGGGSGLEMEVHPDDFRGHLDWLSGRFPVVHLDDALAAPADDTVVLSFDDGYASLFHVAFPLLVERRLPFTLYLTTEPVETGVALRDHVGAEPLTWRMTKEMMDSGLMTVGAHTHTHPDFRFIDAAGAAAEIDVSNDLISARLGIEPVHFAYPWGYWSKGTDAAIRSRYRSAALGSPLPRPGPFDPHLPYRLPVQLSDGSRWFGPRVRQGLLLEEAVRRRLRGYAGP